MFHTYVNVYQRIHPIKTPLNHQKKSHENPIQPAFSYGFPMIYQRVRVNLYQRVITSKIWHDWRLSLNLGEQGTL